MNAFGRTVLVSFLAAAALASSLQLYSALGRTCRGSCLQEALLPPPLFPGDSREFGSKERLLSLVELHGATILNIHCHVLHRAFWAASGPALPALLPPGWVASDLGRSVLEHMKVVGERAAAWHWIFLSCSFSQRKIPQSHKHLHFFFFLLWHR